MPTWPNSTGCWGRFTPTSADKKRAASCEAARRKLLREGSARFELGCGKAGGGLAIRAGDGVGRHGDQLAVEDQLRRSVWLDLVGRAKPLPARGVEHLPDRDGSGAGGARGGPRDDRGYGHGGDRDGVCELDHDVS